MIAVGSSLSGSASTASTPDSPRPVAVADARRVQAEPLDGLEVGLLAAASRGELHRSRDVEEPPVPELDEPLHELGDRGAVGEVADAAHLVVEVGRDDDRGPLRRLLAALWQQRSERENALDLPGVGELEHPLGPRLGAHRRWT